MECAQLGLELDKILVNNAPAMQEYVGNFESGFGWLQQSRAFAVFTASAEIYRQAD
jgi:hypothetical protein